MKQNASLRSVVGAVVVNWNDDDLFNVDDKRRLITYYAARNEGLSQWIASPVTEPRGARAKALEAHETGPDIVFRILQALGTFVAPVEGKRCRKRPRLYSPS